MKKIFSGWTERNEKGTLILAGFESATNRLLYQFIQNPINKSAFCSTFTISSLLLRIQNIKWGMSIQSFISISDSSNLPRNENEFNYNLCLPRKTNPRVKMKDEIRGLNRVWPVCFELHCLPIKIPWPKRFSYQCSNLYVFQFNPPKYRCIKFIDRYPN